MTKCWIYKKRLYLYRQGELTAGEKRSLEKHLDSCGRCRQEAVQIRGIEQHTASLRAEKAALSRPEELTDAVMRRIRGGMGVRRTEGPSFRLPVFVRRIPRFVYAVLAAAIIGSFFYQEYRILAKISRLEERMAGIPVGGRGIPAEPVLDRLPAGLRNTISVPRTVLEKQGLDTGDYWILIKRSELDSLIRAYRDSRMAVVPELAKIRRMLVEWNEKEFLSPGYVQEMNWMIRHKREWLQKIDRL